MAVPGVWLVRPLVDFLYPPVCAGCRGAIAQGPALCGECWRSLRFIERPYCETLGTPLPFDHGPGALSPQAIANPPVFARARAAVIHRDLAARLVSSLKYADRTELAVLMAGWMARAGAELLREADLVVPVPLHARRLWRRQFNQAAELARLTARRAGRPYAPLVLKRVKATRSQVGLGARERATNVRGAFLVPPRRRAEVEGRRLLLVDDVFTTGSTLSSATRALLRAGAASVDVLTFARVAADEA